MKLINKIDVFSPYLVIFAIFLYVLFGITGFYYEIKGLQAPPLGIYIYILLGCCFFVAGVLFPKLVYKLNFKSFESVNNFLNYLYSKKDGLNKSLNEDISAELCKNFPDEFL